MQVLFQKLYVIFTTPEYIGLFFEGLKSTLIMSVCASVLGLILGTLVAIVKIASEDSKASRWWSIPNFICNVYITVIRGTPMALQLFIWAFVIFTIRGFPSLLVAVFAFGVNSGAYVAENIRAGILSVDIGQTEAGRSLGLTGATTMRKIVIPQAVKNVIPAIGNELIALIKETSIVSMIGGVYDITIAAKNLGTGKYLANYLAPMMVAAGFYLAIVYALSFAIKVIEKRLRAGDKR